MISGELFNASGDQFHGSGYRWEKCLNEHIPFDAVVAGKDEYGRYIFAGRFFNNGWEVSDLLPAKIVTSSARTVACATYAGQALRNTDFEILCGAPVCWIESNRGRVPHNAIPVGNTASGETLFMGRVCKGSRIIPGKIHPSLENFYFEERDREASSHNCEVMTYPSQSYEQYPPRTPAIVEQVTRGIDNMIGQTFQPAVPSLPPLDPANAIPNYTGMSFAPMLVPPNTMQQQSVLKPMDCWKRWAPIPGAEQLSETEARSHLAEYVSKQSCWGSEPVRKLQVMGIESVSTFHYVLESFIQTREVTWTTKAWKSGLHVAGQAGPVPNAWEIQATPTQLFQDETREIQVPNTEMLKSCHECGGQGTTFCEKCGGRRWTKCSHCDGEGYRTRFRDEPAEECWICKSSRFGRGSVECGKCSGEGKIGCKLCQKSGLLLCYIQLTINWKVMKSEYALEKTGLPQDLLSKVSGNMVYSEQGLLVDPLSNLPEDAVIAASCVQIEKHRAQYANQILCQRQQVRVVPVTYIRYTYQGNAGGFFIYGNEKEVHAPDYPDTCACCCCTIL